MGAKPFGPPPQDHPQALGGRALSEPPDQESNRSRGPGRPSADPSEGLLSLREAGVQGRKCPLPHALTLVP